MASIISSKTLTTTTARWHFVLHGGCSETCADADRQRETVENLQAVAESVSRALSQGATAKEAVVLAVAALEDCPTFNAGHGAALNEDGVHQVSPFLYPTRYVIRAHQLIARGRTRRRRFKTIRRRRIA